MVNFADFLRRTAQDVACGYLESVDNYNDWVNGAYNASAPGLGLAIYGSGQASNLRNMACSLGPPPNNPPSPTGARPVLPVGRAGGYCDVTYQMNVVWNYKLYPSGVATDNPPAGSAVVQIKGPVGGFYTEGYPSPELFAINGDGVPVLVNGIFNDSLDYDRITSVSFARVDGLPDNCVEGFGGGTPAPIVVLPPLDPPGINLPSVVIPVILPGAIQLNGEVTFNVGFDFSGATINASVNLSTGDVSLNFGGGSSCCGPELIGPPSDGGGPDDPEYNDVDPDVIVGLFVRATVEPNIQASVTGGPGSPNVYFPRLGMIQFSYKSGGRTGWSVDIPIKKLSQYIPAEGPIWPTGYSLIELPGVQLSVDTVRIKRSLL